MIIVVGFYVFLKKGFLVAIVFLVFLEFLLEPLFVVFVVFVAIVEQRYRCLDLLALVFQHKVFCRFKIRCLIK